MEAKLEKSQKVKKSKSLKIQRASDTIFYVSASANTYALFHIRVIQRLLKKMSLRMVYDDDDIVVAASASKPSRSWTPSWCPKLLGGSSQSSPGYELLAIDDNDDNNNNNNDDDDSKKDENKSWRIWNDLKTLRQLSPYLWPEGEPVLRFTVVLSLVFLVLSKVCNLFVPQMYRNIINHLTGSNSDDITMPTGWIIGYGALKMSSALFANLRDAVFVRVRLVAQRQASLEAFEYLQALSLRWHLNRQTGSVLRAISRGQQGISYILSFLVFHIFPTLLEIAMVFAYLVTVNFWIAAFTLATIVGYIVYTLGITEWRSKFRKEQNTADNAANDLCVDALINFETVKYFGNEAHEAHRYNGALLDYQESAEKSTFSLALLNVGQSIIMASGSVAVMAFAAYKVVHGAALSVGDVVLVNAYLAQLYAPLNFLGSSYRMVTNALIDLATMFEIFANELDDQDDDTKPLLQVSEGVVEFDNVTFSYDEVQDNDDDDDDDKDDDDLKLLNSSSDDDDDDGESAAASSSQQQQPVLNSISFRVPAGKQVALVGASGAGKSTIVKLLFRLYKPQSGRILIDGQDISQVRSSSLRSQIGIVPQDTVLFNDTIGYNISYGRPGCSQQEIELAAQRAQIHDFIMGLPDGYETKVGERGLRLSGGERQRVSIARTLLKNPPITAYDEATSSLDTHTEREIMTSLDDVARGRTTITIAHRLATIVNVDEILVLKGGNIVERGSHHELVSRLDSLYADLWHQQTTESMDDDDDSIKSKENDIISFH
jgi:ATP-binding cassette, subfamily B, heavy metal transporter